MTPISATITIGGKNAIDFFASLLELEIEEDFRAAAVMRLKLAIQKRANGLWTYLDDDRIALWKTLAVSVTVGGKTTELFSGYVTEIIPHIDVAEENSSLELKGMDATCLMNLEEKIRDWPGKNDSEIAREVFRPYVMMSEVTPTDVIYMQEVGTIMQRETDIQFLKRLARRNGFECFVKSSKGYFRKPALRAAALPTLAAHFGDQTNLVSFDAKANSTRPARVGMSQLDPIAKEVQAAAVGRTQQPRLGTKGTSALSVPGGHTPQLFVRHAVALNKAEMENLSHALYDEAEWFVEGSGEVETGSYGAVLEARRLVAIKGVGELFSGVYYLTNVRHLFNGDSYMQRFKARRNALVPTSADFAGLASLFGA